MLSQTDRSRATGSNASDGRREAKTPPPPSPESRLDAGAPPASTGRGPATSRYDAATGGASTDGPPPPPVPNRLPSDDHTPRSTAATWVAATGALLLLVAAGTFLAVSWDVLGMTARVAVVASITAAAIIGGHRLRQFLPAVGAVLFHLGALLLPIDALGLALQLELSVAAAWILTGAVTLVALPPLAITGRSRVLAAAAVTGVPVLATGLGLAGLAAPSLVVAVAGALSLLTLGLRGTRVARIWRGGPVALATTAVLLPLVATALDASLAQGRIVMAIRSAGWVPSSWVVPVIVGILAVATVSVVARVLSSRRLAALAPVLGAVAGIVAILPEGSPRLAVLLIAPTVLLLAEVVAIIAHGDDAFAEPMRWTARILELVAAFGAVIAAQLVVAPTLSIGTASDPELAVALLVATVAFAAALVRDRLAGGALTAVPVVLAGAIVLHGVAALTVALPGDRSSLAAVVFLAVVGLGLVLPGGKLAEAATSRLVDPAKAWVAVTLAVLACAAAWNGPAALPVAALAAPLVGLHLRPMIVAGHPLATVMTALVAPIAALSGLVLAGHDGATSGLPALGELQGLVLQVAVAVVALFGLAVIIDRVGVVADVIRGFGVAVLLLVATTSDLPVALFEQVTSRGQMWALELLRPVPALLVVVGPAAVWLVLDAVRVRRTAVAVLAAPVVVQLATTVAVGFGVGPVVLGGVLLGLGLVALTGAVTSKVTALRVSLIVVAVLSALPGWALIGATAEARAIALIALGLAGVAIGVVRRSPLVGHGGGVVATLGIWLLLDLRGIDAVDVWTLPVAVQLAAAGMRARRAGTLSSWAVDVPPLLLVAIPAIGERLTGGSGLHALLAGAVAMVAVVYGGAAGRGGPLTSGILILLVVVTVETVAYAALVPTWAWFAVAGSVLLGAAVLIERKGLSPSRAVDKLKDLATDERPA